MSQNKKSQVHFEMLVLVIKLLLIAIVLIALFQSTSSLMSYDYLKKKLLATEISSLYTSIAIIPANTSIVYSRDNFAIEGFDITLSNHKISTKKINNKKGTLSTTSFWTPYPKTDKVSNGKSQLKVTSKVSTTTKYEIAMPELIQKNNSSGNNLTLKQYTYLLTPEDKK